MDFELGMTIPTISAPLQKLISQGAKEHPEVVTKYLETEVAKGRMLGPFPTQSFPGTQISRIGIIPKKRSPGKWRLITDLSFPSGQSVNDGINPELTSLSYIKVDEVATMVVHPLHFYWV